MKINKRHKGRKEEAQEKEEEEEERTEEKEVKKKEKEDLKNIICCLKLGKMRRERCKKIVRRISSGLKMG